MYNDGSQPSSHHVSVLLTLSRHLIRGLLGVFTALVILLAQSALWAGSVSTPAKVVLAAVAVLSYWRPREGLLAVAGLAPLAVMGSRLLGAPQLRGPEALVLAFLAGALLKGWKTGRLRAFPATRLELAALLVGLVVAASCVEQLWFLQIQLNYPWTFLRDAARYAAFGYLVSLDSYGTIFSAMLLVEGLALLLYAAEAAGRDAAFRRQLARIIVLSATGAAALNVVAAVTAPLETGAWAESIWRYLSQRRWTFHVGDVNAAGAYFAMASLVALGLLQGSGRRRLWWLLPFAAATAALWLTGSASAQLPWLLVVAAVAVRSFVPSSGGRPLQVAAAVLILVAGVGFWLALGRGSSAATASLAFRRSFNEASLRMWASRPVFGVGVGQYRLWSAHYFSPELRLSYPRENAHNSFLQLGAELGLAGAGALGFLAWVVLAALGRRQEGALRVDGVRAGAIAGAVAFLISCAGGNHLLVPAVVYPFALTLGLGVGARERFVRTDADRGFSPDRGLTLAAAVVLAVSVPGRVAAETRHIEIDRITWGLYDTEVDPRGTRFQWTAGNAAFFVRSEACEVVLPLRALLVGPNRREAGVVIGIEGRPGLPVALTDGNWHEYRFQFPARSDPPFRRIDLRVLRPWRPVEAIPGSDDVRELGVMVGEVRVTCSADRP